MSLRIVPVLPAPNSDIFGQGQDLRPGRGGLFQGSKNWEPRYGGGEQGWEALPVTSQMFAECSLA